MNHKTSLYFILIFTLVFLAACNNSENGINNEEASVKDNGRTETINTNNIKEFLEKALGQNGRIGDSVQLKMAHIIKSIYDNNGNETIWLEGNKIEPLGDSLIRFIKDIEYQGLFPKDVNQKPIMALYQKILNDSTGSLDKAAFTKFDVLLTDALARSIKDLKYGRLKADSLALKTDTTIGVTMFNATIQKILKNKNFSGTLHEIQPKYRGYWDLKNALPSFVKQMDRRTYTYVSYPFKKGDIKDSLFFIKKLQKRLFESNALSNGNKLIDSTELATGIKKYQVEKGLKVDGKYGAGFVKALNVSDDEKFKRVAITLDKYKLLPDTLPEKFIWVNIPAYHLEVWDNDTLALTSKVIVGKPDTRTPELNSDISDMVIYPTWTVPNSIIVKQYLPKLKNNPGYLRRIGLKLVDGKGREVNPYGVGWGKYSKGIPYRVMQNSGNNNALGIFKFNFPNKYAVYLHDTNQRYLFKNSARALSHGCVRVQEWEKLAYYIARNDSMNVKKGDSLHYNTDSLRSWLAKKELRRVDVKNHIAVYIRYFSVEGIAGQVRFHEDIYNEDKEIREKYFAHY